RARLSTHDPLLGAWTFLREPLAAEVASGAGYDYVCIDGQHGIHDYASIVGQLTSIAAGGMALPIVRVPWNEPGFIGQVLDAGAGGVIVPMVNTVEQAEAVVRACRYAPVGARSLGPIGASTRYGPAYVPAANEFITVIPMIETVEAVGNVEKIAATPGVDALYIGPADLSMTLGLPPAMDQDDARFNDALLRVVAACQAAGIVPGIHSDPALVAKRRDQGFRMITIGYDLQPMIAGLHRALNDGRRA
ncbi:MAG: aldolase/citrate lyase family protein, partial [Ilumatobacteraceae bacterium]